MTGVFRTPARHRLLSLVAERPMGIVEAAHILGLRQSAISKTRSHWEMRDLLRWETWEATMELTDAGREALRSWGSYSQ